MANRRCANVRKDQIHKASYAISKSHAAIASVATEDLRIKHMMAAARVAVENPGAIKVRVTSPFCHVTASVKGNARRASLIAGALAAVNVQYLAGHERRGFEVHHSANDIRNVTHPAQWRGFPEGLVRLNRLHPRLRRPRGYRVDANARRRVFNRESLGGRI